MRVTFLGDIMCEPPVLAGAKQPDGSYNFDYVFSRCQSLFAEADYLVGNLETPLAGEEAGYSATYLAFNAPDAYADAIKKAAAMPQVVCAITLRQACSIVMALPAMIPFSSKFRSVTWASAGGFSLS